MRTLLTGATGYLGRQLALSLANDGHQVNILVRDPASPYIPVHPNIFVFEGQLTNAEDVKEAITGCTTVLHAAAEIKAQSATMLRSNIGCTKCLLDASLQEGISKFVFISTCAILAEYSDHPVTEDDVRLAPIAIDYERSKSIAGKMVKDYSFKGLNTVIISLSKIFGPGLDRRSPGMMSMLQRAMEGKMTLVPGPQPVVSNFVFINDAINGIRLALQKGKSGENYILGGENLSFNDFFQIAASHNRARKRLIYVPLQLAKFLTNCCGSILQSIGKTPLVTTSTIQELYRTKLYSSEKAIRELGYHITPIEEALFQTVEYIKRTKMDSSYGDPVKWEELPLPN